MKWYKGIAVEQDPDSDLDWAWDYSDWLEAADSLATKTVTADAGITVDGSEISGDKVVVWLSGGTAGTSYDVAVKAVTADGRTVEHTVAFQVSEQ